MSELRPAPYNPREIDDAAFDRLCASLRRWGVMLPVIVNPQNMTLIAGHQRTRACAAVGIEEVPCFFASGVSPSDEVLFNQIHNGTDLDEGAGACAAVALCGEAGYADIPPGRNRARCEYKAVVAEVCKVLQRYGNVMSCVVASDGRVVKAPAYADACRTLGLPCHAFVLGGGDDAEAAETLAGDYGRFSYGHLEKHTWVQGLAQLPRRMGTEKRDGTQSRRGQRSRLYEELVIPNVSASDAMLDFGAGKELYARTLRSRGYDVECLEWYHNNGSSVDVSAARREAVAVIRHLRERGRYDAVVCDSVLNSVDSREAERAVVGACSALLRPGGTLFLSGRTIESAQRRQLGRRKEGAERLMEFLDSDGLSARFRKGQFYYQMFHSKERVLALVAEHGFEVAGYLDDSTAWRCRLVKAGESPWADESVRFEFSLPYPGGRYEFAEDALGAMRAARDVERAS